MRRHRSPPSVRGSGAPQAGAAEPALCRGRRNRRAHRDRARGVLPVPVPARASGAAGAPGLRSRARRGSALPGPRPGDRRVSLAAHRGIGVRPRGSSRPRPRGDRRGVEDPRRRRAAPARDRPRAWGRALAGPRRGGDVRRSDRRARSRKNRRIPCQLRLRDHVHHALVIDLSAQGLFVRMAADDREEIERCQLTLESERGEQIELVVDVVRKFLVPGPLLRSRRLLRLPEPDRSAGSPPPLVEQEARKAR
ncbi:MAG: hypothetical protein E6J87_19385 [Deltaproteobacteria bacterium]|nr:MAG: hypothetical protein E6J87_19385 [Deltaproteobacteria bacterium]